MGCISGRPLGFGGVLYFVWGTYGCNSSKLEANIERDSECITAILMRVTPRGSPLSPTINQHTVCHANQCENSFTHKYLVAFAFSVVGQRTEHVKTRHVKTDRFRGDFRGHFRGNPRGTFRGDFRGESLKG